jgi:cytochrome c oxidase subunit 1
MFNETLGKLHFWATLLGGYSIFLPMHYAGILGMPRRYFTNGPSEILDGSLQGLNAGITVAAMIVAAAQILFFLNIFWTLRFGPKSDPNPWRATTLEWQTPDHPPKHGNWGKELPQVYRWAYDFSVPGAPRDYVPQNEPSGKSGRQMMEPH